MAPCFKILVLTVVLFLASPNLIEASGGKTLSAGDKCHPNGSSKCGKNLRCEDEVCKIEDGGVCTTKPRLCISGKSCVGTGSTKKCKSLMGVGERCQQDPFWVCERGLRCEDNVCKIPSGEVCTDNTKLCANGLSCVGTGSKKKCKTLMGVGERCERDPFWVCESVLSCEDNVCKISSGGVCTDNTKLCAKGLSCVGTGTLKKCKTLRKVNQKCGKDPFWVCKSGLVCQGTCKIAEDGVCTSSTKSCATGLACVGLRRTKRCKVLVSINGVCGKTDFDICKRGLVCQKKKCKIPNGQSCDGAPKTACVSGTVCVKESDKGPRCLVPPPVKVGGTCKKAGFDKCSKGLVCESNVCKIGRLGVCTKNNRLCAKGLSCVGAGKTKKCNMLMGPGKKCETDPFWFCQKGLVCQKKECKIAEGDVCTKNTEACVRGTECVGTAKTKKCKRPMGLGKRCGKDPFWVCLSSLVCDEHDGKCKIPKGGVCGGPTAKLCVSGTKCGGGSRRKCL